MVKLGGRGAITGLLLLALTAQVWASQDEKTQETPPVRLESPIGPDAPRSQDVSLGYRFVLSYPHHLDRDNIASESMAAMDLLHLGLQDSGTDGAALRLLKWGIASWVDTSVMYVAHEYGHVSSISKTGYHDAVEGNVNGPANMQPVTPFSLFVEGLQFPVGRMISVSDSDWTHINAMFTGHPQERIRFIASLKAGGINEEQILADRYSQRLLDGEMSYLDTVPFFWGAISTLTYPTGIKLSDIDNYASTLDQEGLGTSGARIKALSAVELLSGSSLASAWGFVKGLFTASPGRVEPILFNVREGVRVALPEFGSTLSEMGPTIRTGVPILVSGWEIVPSYEALVVSGGHANEGGLEVRGPIVEFLEFRAESYFSDGAGRWLEGGFVLRPLSWLALSLGYVSAHGYTFHRDLYGSGNDFLDKGERSIIAGLVLSKRF